MSLIEVRRTDIAPSPQRNPGGRGFGAGVEDFRVFVLLQEGTPAWTVDHCRGCMRGGDVYSIVPDIYMPGLFAAAISSCRCFSAS